MYVAANLTCSPPYAYTRHARLTSLPHPPRLPPHTLQTTTDDGKHPCLSCATSAGKVFIHSPHERNTSTSTPGVAGSIRFLNINKKITALAAGQLNQELARDVLMIGTQVQ